MFTTLLLQRNNFCKSFDTCHPNWEDIISLFLKAQNVTKLWIHNELLAHTHKWSSMKTTMLCMLKTQMCMCNSFFEYCFFFSKTLISALACAWENKSWFAETGLQGGLSIVQDNINTTLHLSLATCCMLLVQNCSNIRSFQPCLVPYEETLLITVETLPLRDKTHVLSPVRITWVARLKPIIANYTLKIIHFLVQFKLLSNRPSGMLLAFCDKQTLIGFHF